MSRTWLQSRYSLIQSSGTYQQLWMIVLQPRGYILSQLIRNLDDFFKILLRDIAGRIVVRRISLLREDLYF
jgi:hypothetical protein